MTPCDDCNATREAPAHRMFNPVCLHCGARLIQRLGKLPRPKDEITARRRQVLADWMAQGHPEADLRRLAKGPVPLAPESSPVPPRRGR
jgi:hypothetical protein